MTGVPPKSALRFGIPSLDDLFGNFSLSHRAYGILIEVGEQVKLTIIGPEGSGKSIFACHLASRYAADALSRVTDHNSMHSDQRTPPKVIYISTDLTITKASTMWSAFELNRPNLREVPFYRSTVDDAGAITVIPTLVGLDAELVELFPLEATIRTSSQKHKQGTLAEFLAKPNPERNVDIGFIDLISHPVGDIWSLCTRLLASLETIEDPAPFGADQHLIIIDNVDGFEVFMGELNAFGDRSSVRARIMQTVQAAARKAHLVFVSEEQGTGARPLSDISDAVVRLAIRQDAGYKYRTVEIEKARAQAIHRGDHYVLIRTGSGSTTGMQENPDDPRTTNAYVQIVPSLNTTSRRVMNEPAQLPLVSGLIHSRRAGFGLHNLDELCGSSESKAGSKTVFRNDPNGLRFGTLTGILGDPNTYKTYLAHQFIRRGFELFTEQLRALVEDSSNVKILKALREIQDAHSRRIQMSEMSQNPDQNGSVPDEQSNVEALVAAAIKLLEKTPLDLKQAEFLARVLLLHRTGIEEALSVQEIAAEILDPLVDPPPEGKLKPALAFVISSWLGQMIFEKLKRTPQEPEELAAVCRVTLPESFLGDPLQLAVMSARQVPGEDLLNAAVKYWASDRNLKPPHMSLAAYDNFFNLYIGRTDEPVPTKAKLAQKVAQTISDAEQTANQAPADKRKSAAERDSVDVEKQRRAEWGKKTVYSFLRTHYPGSVDRLTEEEKIAFKKRTSTIIQQKFERPLFLRMFAGFASKQVDVFVQEGRSNIEELRNWLGRAGYSPVGDKFDLVSAMVQSLKVFGTLAEWSDITDAENRDKDDPTTAELSQIVRNLIDNQIVPNLIDSDRYGGEKITAELFSKWLFNVSPKAHPFAEKRGIEELTSEVVALLEAKETEVPVLCAALVAAILQLIRSGKLATKSDERHIGNELSDRREATETLVKLETWVKGSFGGSRPDSSEQKRIAPLQAFVQAAIEATAARSTHPGGGPSPFQKKHLAKLVQAVSDSQGFFVDMEKLKNGDLDTRIRVCRLILEEACREGLLDGPAILVTTSNTRFESISAEFKGWRDQFCLSQTGDKKVAKGIADVAMEHLREWLIIRRLEVHYLPTATLAMIIRRCVETAQKIVCRGPIDDPDRWEKNVNDRRAVSWNVRLVIDGLAGMKQTYPNVVSDALFLPALRFYIGRESLTAIVVATQGGSPNSIGEDPFEKETINMLLHQIRIWRVLFYGELRVAVAFLPPAPEYGTAKVREIISAGGGRLEVNSHFELYKGLETGRAERVPLEVRLVGDTRALQAYQSSLNAVLGDVFPGVASDSTGGALVVFSDSTANWNDKLRDFGRLHRNSRLDQTLILQIDEHWAFRRSDALRNQWRYLSSSCLNESGAREKDTLEVFQPTLADEPGSASHRRLDRFVWNGYYRADSSALTPAEQRAIDRIPFLWDFGFLLCHREAWDSASTQPFQVGIPERTVKSWLVSEVWNNLHKISGSRLERKSTGPIGWRVFLEAAVTTASHHSLGTANPGPGFDLPIRGGGSLACMILELWASEVYGKFANQFRAKHNGLTDRNALTTLFGSFTKRSWVPCRTRGLIGLLAEPESRGGSLKQIFGKALAAGKLPKLTRHSMELFKVLVLLREALDIPSLLDPKEPFRLNTRPVNPKAVCARHWYGTACEFFDHAETPERFIPARLPGHFSMRGDWYLAVAAGSHSSLLADRALDLLSSRRGNFERLRQGLGLPVRDISDQRSGANPRTRLTTIDESGRRGWIRYRDLIALGADSWEGAEEEQSPQDFFWLWRSTLGDYDAQSRAFHQGVIHLMNWWKNLTNIRGTAWKNGFVLYDAIEAYYKYQELGKGPECRKIFADYFAVNSLWEFPEICDEIIDRLQRATPRS